MAWLFVSFASSTVAMEAEFSRAICALASEVSVCCSVAIRWRSGDIHIVKHPFPVYGRCFEPGFTSSIER